MTAPRAMLPACAYVASGERSWRSSELTRGPWHPDHQHAGPPIALAARQIERAAAVLSSGGKEVARFTALAQREADLAIPEGLPGHPLPQAPRPPDASPPAKFPFGQTFTGYPDLVECRVAEGAFFRGPSAIWFRLRSPLIEGEAPSPIERVAVAADSGGIAEARIYDATGLVGRSTQSLAVRRRE